MPGAAQSSKRKVESSQHGSLRFVLSCLIDIFRISVLFLELLNLRKENAALRKKRGLDCNCHGNCPAHQIDQGNCLALINSNFSN